MHKWKKKSILNSEWLVVQEVRNAVKLTYCIITSFYSSVLYHYKVKTDIPLAALFYIQNMNLSTVSSPKQDLPITFVFHHPPFSCCLCNQDLLRSELGFLAVIRFSWAPVWLSGIAVALHTQCMCVWTSSLAWCGFSPASKCIKMHATFGDGVL